MQGGRVRTLAGALLVLPMLASCSGTTTAIPAPTATRSTAKPPARDDAAAAWDATRGQLVLFGGHPVGADQKEALDDTWTWDAAHGWLAHRTAAAATPPKRAYAGMAYDPDLGAVVLVGGTAGTLTLTDSWSWTGTAWVGGPALAAKLDGQHDNIGETASLAWDPGHHQLVAVLCCSVYIGLGAWTVAMTFTGDGHTWTQVDSNVVLPDHERMQLALDPQRGNLLLLDADDFGVNAQPRAWSWDGSDWSAGPGAPPNTPSPSTIDDPRSLLAWSPGDGAVADVTEATSGAAALWLLRDGAWTSGASPAASRFAVVVDDAADGRLLAVGGPSPEHDTEAVLQRTASGWAPATAARAAPAASIPVPTLRPPTVVVPAKDYIPAASAYGSGFYADPRVTPGRAEDAPAIAQESWEEYFEGPGQKLVLIEVVVMPTSAQAYTLLAGGFPARLGDLPPTLLPPPPLGQDAVEEQEAVHFNQGGDASIVHIGWREGRVVFLYSWRDTAAAINPGAALPGAQAVDRLALRLARGRG